MSVGIIDAFKVPFHTYGRTFYWLWVLPGYILLGIIIFSLYGLNLDPTTTEILTQQLISIVVILPFMLPLLGYSVSVIQAFMKGKFDGLPDIPSVKENYITGWYFFLFTLSISALQTILIIIPVVGWILGVLSMFFMILMVFRYIDTSSFQKAWDIGFAWNIIRKNFGMYLLTILKTIVVVFLYFLTMIPIITIPFMIGPLFFAQHVLLADFYRQHKS